MYYVGRFYIYLTISYMQCSLRLLHIQRIAQSTNRLINIINKNTFCFYSSDYAWVTFLLPIVNNITDFHLHTKAC